MDCFSSCHSYVAISQTAVCCVMFSCFVIGLKSLPLYILWLLLTFNLHAASNTVTDAQCSLSFLSVFFTSDHVLTGRILTGFLLYLCIVSSFYLLCNHFLFSVL